jgi:dihydroorotase
MSSILIKNARVVDPSASRDEVADVLVVDGVIKKVGEVSEKADVELDASGLVVAPGLVDIHVHFREPGREDKETLETGSRAALKGGVTSVVTMPNVKPIADNQTVVEVVIKRGRELDLINLFPAGSITKKLQGRSLAEIWELKNSGAVMVTDDGEDVGNSGLLYRAMEYAKTHDMLVMSHCESETLVEDGAMHEGWMSTQLGLPGIPEVSEDVAVMRNILLAKRSGARVHLTHSSTEGAVTAIRDAKKKGIENITADVTPHHFSLTDEECAGYNTNAKMYPALRPREHVNAIIEAIKDGTIDAIATDHAPHIEPDKLVPFVDAADGTIGLETSFAAMITYLVEPGHISLSQGLALMTHKPAKIIRKKKGTLAEGADADIAIFDVTKKWTVDPTKLQSKGKNTVFAGKELTGKAVHAIVGGALKMRDGEIL